MRRLLLQPVDTILGGVDATILERLAKVMSYMRVTAGAKPGKRLKKKDKMRMLEGGDFSVRPLAGTHIIYIWDQCTYCAMEPFGSIWRVGSGVIPRV